MRKWKKVKSNSLHVEYFFFFLRSDSNSRVVVYIKIQSSYVAKFKSRCKWCFLWIYRSRYHYAKQARFLHLLQDDDRLFLLLPFRRFSFQFSCSSFKLMLLPRYKPYRYLPQHPLLFLFTPFNMIYYNHYVTLSSSSSYYYVRNVSSIFTKHGNSMVVCVIFFTATSF